MRAFEIRFTHAAIVQMAAHRIDKVELKSAIIDDVQLGTEQGPDDLDDIAFHMVFWPRAKGQSPEDGLLWFCRPSKDGSFMIVDAGEFKKVDPPKTGHFAPGGKFHGKKIMMPMPQTDDEEEPPPDDGAR